MSELEGKYLRKQRDHSGISVTPPFPKIVKIDICNVCNYGCLFCPSAKQYKKVGNIDDALCKEIIKDAYDAGGRELCVSSMGEPMLNPRLEEYISYAKALGYTYVYLNTNGFLLDEKRSNSLLDSGIDSIKFSINAAARSYYLIHGVEAYEKVLENLKQLYRLRKDKNSGCKIYVSYVATKYTLDEAEEVRKAVGDWVDDYIVVNANNRGGSADEVCETLYVGEDEFSYQYPCSQLFNNVCVTAEGYMIACCQDFENNMVIADLHEMSVAEAWSCENFRALREQYLKGEIEGILCDNCVNNTHKPIVPLQPKYAGYQQSESRVNDVKERVRRLIEAGKEEKDIS